ncbi:hypothetical protein M3B61_11390 [Micrococcus luteus]|nr:hypothetical protein [Micrococcus luteus]MCV7584349.1 hypothetical protein [Micrococcus luteus]MCV7589083.1 hypothetical protein [Micrococcus luteus]
MTEQATTETPTVHWPGADEAEDTAWINGWNEAYRRGYDTARASAPRRQAALEAFSTAWTAAAATTPSGPPSRPWPLPPARSSRLSVT